MAIDMEAAETGLGTDRSPPAELSPALRLQVIQMEQASLLWQRSLTWNEAFNRSTMFIAAVSGSIIAIAFVAQAASFGRTFMAIGFVILGVTLAIGLATWVRLIDVNKEDLLWVQGLNRLRHAYLELAGDLAPYLVSGWHDDDAGVLASLGAGAQVRPIVHHVIVTTPAVVAMIDAVLAAAMVSLASLLIDLPIGSCMALGLGTFAAVSGSLLTYQLRSLRSRSRRMAARFPTPSGAA